MDNTEKVKKGKFIQFKVNETIYRLEYDGFSFVILVGESGENRIPKYPSTMSSAIKIILKREHLAIQDEKALTLLEFAKQYEDLVKQIENMDFSNHEVELKTYPVKGGRPKKSKPEESEEDDDDIF